MRVLASVKRVPAPGARIVLTDDAQAIDTTHLGFAMSPHEECAVEESIRIVEQHGGSATVLTLGAPEAEEQLRYALSLGADEGVLVPTDGSDWDPQATAAALAAAIRELEETAGPFDLLLFGNEAADSGGYQVGIRVAHALGRPIVSGIKGIDIGYGEVTARRQTDDGHEIYRLPLPAVLGVKEGLNLPRYPTLKGRLQSKKKEIARTETERVAGSQAMVRLVRPPEQVSDTQILGEGAAAAPAIVELLRELSLA